MFYYILSSLILASVVLHASYSYRLLQSTLTKKSSFGFLVIYILFICVEGLKGTLLSGLYHTGG